MVCEVFEALQALPVTLSPPHLPVSPSSRCHGIQRPNGPSRSPRSTRTAGSSGYQRSSGDACPTSSSCLLIFSSPPRPVSLSSPPLLV
eukprot:723851-Hanusia_phi.AAC.1